jgi:hypothetical protein
MENLKGSAIVLMVGVAILTIGNSIACGKFPSPSVIEIDSKAQVIAPQGDGWLHSVDSLMGETIWKFELNSKTLMRLLGVFIPLVVLVVFWLVPILLGAWMLQRKGYSPRWMLFGILPIVGWLVLLVAVLLAVRPETPEASSILEGGQNWQEDEPVSQEGEQAMQVREQVSVAFAQYEKGMKELGNGLIVLGVLQALVGAGLMAFSPAIILGLVIVNITALNIYLGVFARKLHAWVNYVVAVLACVLLAHHLINLFSEEPNPGFFYLVCCVRFVIPAALLYYSVNNIQKLSRASTAANNDDPPPNE